MEIQNYPNYLIYEDGRVWSKKRTKSKGGFLKQNNQGHYLIVSLCLNGKPKQHYIHRLVGIHYIPNPENKEYIDHIDGDKLNNNIDNLRWVSSIENCNYFKSQKSNNTSGHKCINWTKQRQEWRFQKIIFGKRYGKNFKTKQEAIIYKFIFLKFLSN
tara:strand:+ start:161 stop:631 length:471 start_codon:yes stop_codon:yes gene_type:complete